jgi:integrase
VLAVRRFEVDVISDPPTMKLSGTMIDHDRVTGKPLHRQESRKGDDTTHTVVLPEFGVKALVDLLACGSDPLEPLFANRNGGWTSLGYMRSQLRKALPEDLRWVTPHSFRRTVATVVSDHLGPAAAQRQLDHHKLDTTETHYIVRPSIGPDAREVLDRFAADAEGEVRESGE